MEKILTVEKLVKKFGNQVAVNELSFSLRKNEVFGILGPNGSGKTTTLSVILSLMEATSGKVSLFDEELSGKDSCQIGATLETASYFPDFSGFKNLWISALTKGAGKNEVESLLQKVGLSEAKYKKFKNYSLGMKQRLVIASALLGAPELLIFDEPTNGLDPIGIKEVRELILDFKKDGATVILASHLLTEMEKVCDRILILDEGDTIWIGETAKAIDKYGSLENCFLELTK